ncbi:putative protein S-acyltransferase 4 [Sesamum angolense]|uniref:Uncharacterized protein n=1 Tax=Sesamum angolense TaxID=2727404 RepID=A0AAE1X4G7_9LAMI|nr:putative protein S-acyltransferase 4 [Sesamum angolense]
MDVAKPESKRLYQVWRGNNKFLFGGRLIFGPDVASLFLSSFLIVSPAMAFCVKILSIIRHPLSENKDAVPWYPVIIVTIVLTMLTTYENFRYRYSKKENPYNKGVIKNFKEVFLSEIPPSQNNFRAIVEEDEATVAEPSNHSPVDGITSSKEKTDFEMGNKFGENSSPTLPDILRSLEFDDIDENIKDREASERSYSDQLVPLEPDLKETMSSLKVEVDANAEENVTA